MAFKFGDIIKMAKLAQSGNLGKDEIEEMCAAFGAKIETQVVEGAPALAGEMERLFLQANRPGVTALRVLLESKAGPMEALLVIGAGTTVVSIS